MHCSIQQIGFMPADYWNNLDSTDKALFPQLPLIENIARRGKKSKLFDNDGSDNVSSSNGTMHKKQKKIKGIEQKEQHASHESDENEESDETVSSEEESDDESMSYDLFSDKLKKHKGNA